MNRYITRIRSFLFGVCCCLAVAAQALDPGPITTPTQVWLAYDLSLGESTGWLLPVFDLNPNPAAWVAGKVPTFTVSRPSVTRSNLWAPQGGVVGSGRLSPSPTHYLRTRFTLTNDLVASALQIVHLLNDGAVFYLNGQEIGRWNMPDGPLSSTPAALPLGRPLDAHAFVAPADALVLGTNTLAVAVYTSPDAASSAGTCFATRLSVLEQDYVFLAENLTNQVRFEGESIHLKPAVLSAYPFTSQWYFNDQALGTEDGTTLDIPLLTLANSGTYRLVVNTSRGRSLTNSFGLTLLSANIPGSLDPSFVSTGVGPVVRACVVLPDDRIVVGGTFGPLVRLNPDGSLDMGFRPPAALVGVYSLLARPDGSLIVGGDFTAQLGTNAIRGLMRLFPDGTPDTNFVVQTVSGRVLTLAGAPDGKIYLGGEFSSINRTVLFGFGRLNPNGSVDTNFVPKIPYASGRAMLVQPDGRVIVSHTFPDPKKGTNLLSRLNLDGSIDPTFVPPMGPLPGTRYSEFVGALALDDALNVYAGGWFRTYGPVIRTNVVRIKPNGQIDPTFDAGVGQDTFAYNMVPLTDGGVLFLSDLSRFNHGLAGGVARLRRDGSLDTGFLLNTALFDFVVPESSPGNTTSPSVYGVGFQRDGRMILAGNLQSYLGNRLSNVLRVFMPLPSPSLRADKTATEEILISWPIAGGAGEIQSADGVGSGIWTRAGTPATGIGGRWFLRQPVEPGTRYFRHVR